MPSNLAFFESCQRKKAKLKVLLSKPVFSTCGIRYLILEFLTIFGKILCVDFEILYHQINFFESYQRKK